MTAARGGWVPSSYCCCCWHDCCCSCCCWWSWSQVLLPQEQLAGAALLALSLRACECFTSWHTSSPAGSTERLQMITRRPGCLCLLLLWTVCCRGSRAACCDLPDTQALRQSLTVPAAQTRAREVSRNLHVPWHCSRSTACAARLHHQDSCCSAAGDPPHALLLPCTHSRCLVSTT